MRLRTITLGTLTACLAAGLAVPAVAAPVVPQENEAPILIGHRGAAGVAPENTLAAVKAGSQSGADFVEIDVQLSSDGVPFIFHDNTPARTTNVAEVFPERVNDPITSFSWNELQQLDAGSYFSADFAGEKIPHFDAVADVLTGETGVFIEIKSPSQSPGVEQVVADALANDAEWSELEKAGKIEVLGFDAASNKAFAELAPEVPLQQLTGTVPGDAVLADYATYADSFGTSYRTLDAAGAARVKEAGLGLGVYTVNSTEAADASLELGVERITGDFPQQVNRHLNGQKVFPSNNGVVISNAINDVPGNDLQPETGEHVILTNNGNRTIDVGGYVLRDAANNILRIGKGFKLTPGAELRVYSGPGTNTAETFYLGGETAVLNNGGDSLGLWTAKGQLADTFAN
ncbi:glycerophosphodiester phosphodiesterase family protein [Paeniglutamicibacter sulfureus]|uniref:glycerophosphodiester phosphodiesterase family protein n=1 Tax=Paeniglutamicibacter sulfureus TaxID=43666 RepID=UPI0026659100|nr:glycerophosphodiester phosphodiesterase family protein [Paeniglutamicibacter sulfureus]MDO2934564.1 glycerophosphodiester phosphodiesterase family protein [Paeniglutamicibacter sulfureus]